jgi:hypothetical protein
VMRNHAQRAVVDGFRQPRLVEVERRAVDVAEHGRRPACDHGGRAPRSR